MINQQCIIDLLDANDIVAIHVDNHRIGTSVTYHLGQNGTLNFEDSCVPDVVVLRTLAKYNLAHLVGQLQTTDCLCG